MKEILKKIGLAVTALAVLSVTAIGALNGPSVSAAANPKKDVCAGGQKAVDGVCKDDKASIEGVWTAVGTVTQWILMAVGAICVIFIIWGGVRYATSGGDSDKVKKAKNTLLYAIIGLAIAILANVIMTLVVNTLTGANGIFPNS